MLQGMSQSDFFDGWDEGFSVIPKGVFVNTIQQLVNQLGTLVSDGNLYIKADSLLGPATIKATNLALQKYVALAPAWMKVGLSAEDIEQRAETIIGLLSAEVMKRASSKPPARVASTPPKRPVVVRKTPSVPPPGVPEPVAEPWYKSKKVLVGGGIALAAAVGAYFYSRNQSV